MNKAALVEPLANGFEISDEAKVAIMQLGKEFPVDIIAEIVRFDLELLNLEEGGRELFQKDVSKMAQDLIIKSKIHLSPQQVAILQNYLVKAIDTSTGRKPVKRNSKNDDSNSKK